MDQTVQAYHALYLGRLCEISSSTIIVYDHIITLDDEIRLIWKSRWSLGKALFLISRYYNVFIVAFNTAVLFLPSASVQFCFAWLRWQAVTGVLVYGTTEIILMLRLHAMYGQSKKLVGLMAPAFVLLLLVELVILVMSSLAQEGEVNADPHEILPMYVCILQNTWPLSYLYWLPFLVFETMLFTLALVRGVKSYLDHELRLVFDRGKAMRAMEVLLRDSILYFLLIFSAFLVNFLCWVIADGRLGEIPVAFCVSMSSVMSQRLLLNIRKNFEERSAGGPECEDETDLLTLTAATPTFGTGLSDLSMKPVSGMMMMMRSPSSQQFAGNASDCTSIGRPVDQIVEIPV